MNQDQVDDILQRYINEMHSRLDEILDLCNDESVPSWQALEEIALLAAPFDPADPNQLEMDFRGAAHLRLVVNKDEP